MLCNKNGKGIDACMEMEEEHSMEEGHSMEEEHSMEEKRSIDKHDIRKAILQARDNLSPVERKRGNILLTERILGHQWFYRSGVILGFVSYGSEIDTGEILQEAFRKGKKVYVPKVIGKTEEARMRFYRITSLEELQEGYRGIPEPSGTSEEYVYTPAETDQVLMLMPGVAFDRFRGRIGYGKGFYDRFLQDKPQLWQRTIGVGYKCQLVEELPVSEHDIRPYQVICV